MGYRVLVNGVPVECDSAEEAMALASRLKPSPDVKARHLDSPEATSPSASGVSRWTEGRVRDFLQMMDGSKGKVLTALVENPDGRTQVQLIQALGLSSGRELSGVMAGLIKNAKKVGADPNDVYQREVVMIGGEKHHEYRLSDVLRQAIARNDGQIK